jgi:GT2 family glycosyltransferase
VFQRLRSTLSKLEKGETLLSKVLKTIDAHGIPYTLSRLREHLEILIFGATKSLKFSKWYKNYSYLELRRHPGSISGEVKFSILIPIYCPKVNHLKRAIESVQLQSYSNWEICIADDGTSDTESKHFLQGLIADPRIKIARLNKNLGISHATNAAAKISSGSFFVFLDQDDELTPNALEQLGKAILRKPNIKYIYSDEMKISDKGGPLTHHFKSDLNLELAWSYNYFCHLAAISAKLFKSFGGMRPNFDGAQDYDLALRVIDSLDSSEIYHIDKILYRWRVHDASSSADPKNKTYAVEAGLAALNDRIVRNGIRGTVRIRPNQNHQWYEFFPDLPDIKPLVSVIILTRDKLVHLKAAVDSVLVNNNYDFFELIIIDNKSAESETKEYLRNISKDPRVRIVQDDSEFNYSALNNKAAAISKGELLLFLNNDIESINANWIEELVGAACQEGVGVVGAKLYFPNNTVQHAGVILGIGGAAGHSHKYASKEQHGYMGRINTYQQLSAVTGACMLVRRESFIQVAGFTERLAVSFNDVDLCLKIARTGQRIVYNPRAELIHHESATRGKVTSPEEVKLLRDETLYMQKVWQSDLIRDPYYNINLTRKREDWSLDPIIPKH